jgi:protein transport protein SEC24
VRPPQPAVFFFLIDVTYGAVQSGMVAAAANAILNTLDQIPDSDGRAKIGFITFDSSLHFYNLGVCF